ncbi:MAG: GxxExxY protein [Saprospiraceae bacterium]|nr:GxxExxY protein [Candidatus Brachybacter algidus]
MLVEEKIVLELKSVKTLNDIHLTQMITYLKLGKFPFRTYFKF